MVVIGGNLGYLPPDQVIPPIEQYAEAITRVLYPAVKDRESYGKTIPTLVLESGRAVVDESGWLIASVVANKRLPDGRTAVVVDAGINLLFTALWYNHEVRPVRPLEGMPEEKILYGPLCMNIDVVRASIKIPPLVVGDLLSFWPVGAYNNTQWLQFITYRPAVVLVRAGGEVNVIRKAEQLEDITRLEQIPEDLLNPFHDCF